jgi:hypothetical protein
MLDLPSKMGIKAESQVIAKNPIHMGIIRSTHYSVECIRDGEVIWTEEFDNLVVTDGLNDSLDKHFKGSGYTAACYVGLTSSSPSFYPGDVMNSHAGWTEVQTYDEGTREALTLGSISGGSVNNSASKASFTISGTVTIGGAFITSIDTKGGTTGVLYGGGAFGQNRDLVDSDVLNVTITLTASAS